MRLLCVLVRREFVIPKNGPEQKYFGVLGPSTGKIICLIFYKVSHVALKNCGQLHYPNKLSVVLNPVESQEVTVAAILVFNILIIFFSPEPALIWTDFLTKFPQENFQFSEAVIHQEELELHFHAVGRAGWQGQVTAGKKAALRTFPIMVLAICLAPEVPRFLGKIDLSFSWFQLG